MSLNISGFPAFVMQAVFIVLFSAPIWLGAKVVGAERATFLHSVAALVVGVIAVFTVGAMAGGWGLLLAPLSMLLAFKYVLRTSFFGAVILAIVAAAGYALLGHLLSSGISVSSNGINA